MTKYAAPLIMENIDGRTLALKWVKPNSTVLEFGCSYGQMTQYMKETLGCKVYIVELNPEAYSEAIRYAENGVCGDILENKWIEQFGNIQFDYILYIDVLEHLSVPFDVLRNSRELLKDDGEILISVPNVAHNDIAYKLIQGQFEYTPDGLLDETHVHLFTKESLEKMIKDADCVVKEWKYTIKHTGTSEQFAGKSLETNRWWNNVLFERSSGQIYQFVVKVGKKSDSCVNLDGLFRFPECVLLGNIYFDAGRGINEQDKYGVKAILIEENTYKCRETILVQSKHITQFRYDMLEGQSCYLQKLIVIVKDRNGTEKQRYELFEPVFMDGEDPNIFIPIEADNNDQISIDSVFQIEGYNMLEKLSVELQKKQSEIIQQKSKLEQSQYMLQQLKNNIEHQNSMMSQYQERIENYRQHVSELETRINDQEKETQNRIENYRQHVLDLKVRISDLESERQNKIEYIRELKESAEQCQYKYEKLQIDYEEDRKKYILELEENTKQYQYEAEKLSSRYESLSIEYEKNKKEYEEMSSEKLKMEETIKQFENMGYMQKFFRIIKKKLKG